MIGQNSLFKMSYVGAIATNSASFGQGSGAISISSVGCDGTQARLIDCPFSTPSGCSHYHDAGVKCQPMQRGDISREKT